MEKLVVNKSGMHVVALTSTEIEAISLTELEQSLLPVPEAVEDAEFELKLITKLSEWGII